MIEPVSAWIGLGSNMGDSRRIITDALSSLSDQPGITLLDWSSLYSTPPWGDTDQPDFINAVACLETSLPAEKLLLVLQSIELRFGRVRGKRRWGPRLLDLDLLLYAQQTIDLAHLTVPHPRMAERSFVLVPLSEIAPDLNIPGLGAVNHCLAALGSEGINRLNKPAVQGRPQA